MKLLKEKLIEDLEEEAVKKRVIVKALENKVKTFETDKSKEFISKEFMLKHELKGAIQILN